MTFDNALRFLLAAACIVLPIGRQTRAQTGDTTSSDVRAPNETNTASVTTSKSALADFAWLAGRWQGTWGPRAAQQAWTTPNAGVMLGTFQLSEADKTLVLELFTIVEDRSGIKMYLRHFTPSLTAWEKPGPITLILQSADAKSIVFINPVDGQPKQDTITRIDADTYVSRSEIIPEKADAQFTEIIYHRVHDGPPLKRHRRK